MFAVLLLVSSLGADRDNGLEARLNRSLESSVGNFAVSRSMGAWVGVTTPTLRYGFGAGYSDLVSETKAVPDNVLPSGSLTKSWASAYVMQLVDKGDLDLDDRLPGLVDTFLRKTVNTTVVELWGHESNIVNVTLGDVLSMRSGIQDYNDTYLFQITMQDPQRDITPLDFLHMTDKSFVCEPGSCGYYSSINFILVGFVLAQFQNLSSWENLDQKRFLSPEMQERYKGVVFAKKGPCSQYAAQHMTHTYAWDMKVGEKAPSLLIPLHTLTYLYLSYFTL
jgi:hypothetical protein